MLARSTIETWVIKAEKGDPNACPKCDGKVFEAEKMVTATVSLFSHLWHFTDKLSYTHHDIQKDKEITKFDLTKFVLTKFDLTKFKVPRRPKAL